MPNHERCEVWEISAEECERRGYHRVIVGRQLLFLCGEHRRKQIQGAYYDPPPAPDDKSQE